MAAASQINSIDLPAQRDVLQIRIEEKDKSEFTVWLLWIHNHILTSSYFIIWKKQYTSLAIDNYNLF